MRCAHRIVGVLRVRKDTHMHPSNSPKRRTQSSVELEGSPTLEQPFSGIWWCSIFEIQPLKDPSLTSRNTRWLLTDPLLLPSLQLKMETTGGCWTPALTSWQPQPRVTPGSIRGFICLTAWPRLDVSTLSWRRLDLCLHDLVHPFLFKYPFFKPYFLHAWFSLVAIYCTRFSY